MPLPPEFLAVMQAPTGLPNPLPEGPFPLFRHWYDQAHSDERQPNPNAMCLCTVEPDGTPAGRIVLCRGIDLERGHVTFFTNYESAKGRALGKHPWATANFHWDHRERQVRLFGPVVRTPEHESDAYFRRRGWTHRLSAWTSRQSQPLRAREDLFDRLESVLHELKLTPEECLRRRDALEIPRPTSWGGYRLWAQRVELWLGGPGRFHDRALWTRSLTPTGPAEFQGGPWSCGRIQP